VVELALPRLLRVSGGVAITASRSTRPNWGYRSDTSGKRTRWIIGAWRSCHGGLYRRDGHSAA